METATLDPYRMSYTNSRFHIECRPDEKGKQRGAEETRELDVLAAHEALPTGPQSVAGNVSPC